MHKTKNKIGKMPDAMLCGVGVLAAVVITVAMAGIGALCIDNEYFSINLMGFISLFIQFLATGIAVILVGRCCQGKRIVVASLLSGSYFLLLLLVGMTSSNGVGEGIVPSFLAVVLGTGIGVLASNKRRNGANTRKRRYKNR